MLTPHITLRLRATVVAAATLAVLTGLALPAVAASAGNVRLVDGSRTAAAALTRGAPTVTVQASGLLAPVRRRTAAARVRGVRAAALVSPAGGGACADRARSLTGGRWRGTYRWTFRARTTPGNLSRYATARALRRAVRNITSSDNDCGRSDRVSASSDYAGTSDRRPAPTDRGTCRPRDGHNAVGFGRLPDGIAGLTCIWSIGDRIIEADIKLDRHARWATSMSTCNVESLVEAVATHEFGHVFGMGHVSEARHGRLTMSERLDGYCQNGESTLGKGDMLGLEAIY